MGAIDLWAVIGFLVMTLVNVLGFGALLLVNRQGRGEGRQQVQGETIASLRASITAQNENRGNEITTLRRELTDEISNTKAKFGEIEVRLERNLGKVDVMANNLSRLETIVENLTKTVERMVERDDRARAAPAPQQDSLPDVAMLRALALLLKGGDFGKAATSASV